MEALSHLTAHYNRELFKSYMKEVGSYSAAEMWSRGFWKFAVLTVTE